MIWRLCFFVSVGVIIGGILYAINENRRKRQAFLKPLNLFIVSVFFAATIMFIPIFQSYLDGQEFKVMSILLLSIHSAIRLFVVDCDYSTVAGMIPQDNTWWNSLYTLLYALLFVISPTLTFSLVLSFFKNISAYCKYAFGYYREVSVFSEMNEKSLTLAESIRKNDNKQLVVFADVFEKNDEASYEMMERARKIGAALFKKDIRNIHFGFHRQKKSMRFFLIGENQMENIEQTIKLVEKYRNRDNTHVFLFATRTTGEVLLSGLVKGKIKLRRINDIRALIDKTLFDDCEKFFDSALENEDGTKDISAVIVGVGQYGRNMIKALSWYCQMDGYRVSIDAFDKDAKAYEKLYVECPELLSEERNGVFEAGEAQYRIAVHSGVEAGTKSFTDAIEKLKNATYVLVALGEDELNIHTALYLRMIFERMGVKPIIQAVVYNSKEAKALENITNYAGQRYDVDFIGNMESLYSEESITNSVLEEEALSRHLKWGAEDDFWTYEHNYRSSMASAIHMKARIHCGIPGAEKEEKDLTELERDALEVLEHRRWNAYMRSEGFVYSGSPNKSSRNALAKMHNDLVPFEILTEEEKRKDSQVGSR